MKAHYSYIKEQKKRQKTEDFKTYTLMITFATAFAVVIMTSGFMRLWLPGGPLYEPEGYQRAKIEATSTLEVKKPEVPTSTPITQPAKPQAAKNQVTVRVVTAYNVGDERQTDSDPCIGAYKKINLCEALARGEKHVAANFVPFGTKLRIAGVEYTVSDRMHSRFSNRVDIAMPKAELKKALAFGTRKMEVEILK